MESLEHIPNVVYLVPDGMFTIKKMATGIEYIRKGSLATTHPGRVLNLQVYYGTLEFDAAIDINWQLHVYGDADEEFRKRHIPVEFYCADHPEWDVKVVYMDGDNPQSMDLPATMFSRLDFPSIFKELGQWVAAMSPKEAADSFVMWRRIKAGECLPEDSYLSADAGNTMRVYSAGTKLVVDTWYLPIRIVSHIPKESKK